MKEFSSSELFELRNTIPVEMLIQEVLPIPSKISEGIFRFLCPICNEFQTAVNPNTNLARCFRCERNYNAIDLVIEIHGCSFKESVLFLKQLLRKRHGENINQADLQCTSSDTSSIGQPSPGEA